MNKNPRLATAARLQNSPDGMIIVNLEPWDGGLFELDPMKANDGVVLVDPARPAGYGLYLRGDVDSLDRLQKALAGIVRNLRKEETADGSEDAQ
jgi:hypothetical protein